MKFLNHPKLISAGALAIALLAGSANAAADFPVVDILNLRQAISRLHQLSAMYVQGKAQLQQVQLQYDLAVRMAEQIPDLPARYRADFAVWMPITGPDTFGNTSAWVNAENIGGPTEAAHGYVAASTPLSDYSASSFNGLPPEAQARLKAEYATLDMGDAVQVNAIATVGAIRAHSEALQARLNQLDADSFSEAPNMNTTAALLNKINAADDLILHSLQDSNKLMVTLAEEAILAQKSQRDIEAGTTDANIAYRSQFPELMSSVTRNMTQDLQNFNFSTGSSQ
jgi:hypothetical protein